MLGLHTGLCSSKTLPWKSTADFHTHFCYVCVSGSEVKKKTSGQWLLPSHTNCVWALGWKWKRTMLLGVGDALLMIYCMLVVYDADYFLYWCLVECKASKQINPSRESRNPSPSPHCTYGLLHLFTCLCRSGLWEKRAGGWRTQALITHLTS